jgi:hypothetical protein
MFAVLKGSMATHPIATRYRRVVVLVLIGVSVRQAVRQADAQSMPPVFESQNVPCPGWPVRADG